MKEIDFTGKVAVVTGAASGMGLMTSQELARLGAKVVMCDVNAEALRAAAATIGGAAVPCAGDVRDFAHAEAAAKAAEALGGCDILVTCAGGNEARCCKSNVPFYEQPVEVIDWGLDVNLKGAVYFARACMPQMVAKKGGRNLLSRFGYGFRRRRRRHDVRNGEVGALQFREGPCDRWRSA